MTTKSSHQINTYTSRNIHDSLEITVRFLENDYSEKIIVPYEASGKWLLEKICCIQKVTSETEYFGLRYLYQRMLSKPTKHWMDLKKNVHSQLKHTNPLIVTFRIKHYPPNPIEEFALEKSKYLLFHQLHRDFLSGRLIAQHETCVRLAALFIQVTLGDASELDPTQSPQTRIQEIPNYLLQQKLLHNQSKKSTLEIAEEHRKLQGLLPSEAATEAIEIANKLESYGIEPVKVVVQSKKRHHPVHIGLTHEGVSEFSGMNRTHLFKWKVIQKIYFHRKYFILLVKTSEENVNIEYMCDSSAVAEELWSLALEKKLFFTLEKSTIARPIKSKFGLFSRSHTFNFSGRCRSEMINGKTPGSSTLPRTKKLHFSHQTDSVSEERSFYTPSNELRIANATSVNSIISAKNNAFDSFGICEETTEGVKLPDNESIMSRVSESLPLPPETSLAPYFEELPNRKYSSLSRIRQDQKLALLSENRSSITSNIDSKTNVSCESPKHRKIHETIIENNDMSTEAILPEEINSSYVLESVSDRNQHASSNENVKISKLWKVVMFAGGCILTFSLTSVIIEEFDIHTPMINSLRNSRFFIHWQIQFYTPVRSALLGLIHR